jgi:hypothetical protein
MENAADKSSLMDKLRQVGNTKNMGCPYCLINAHFIFSDSRKISSLEIRESTCPSCSGVIVETRESSKELKPQPLGGQKFETMFSPWEIIYPRVKLICTDEKIPTEIRNDLNNANSIIDITADAAAGLARRALERTLRKYLGLKEHRLEDLIKASEKLLHPRIFKLLDAVRGFGNFGAHLKEDSDTADLLLVEKDQALCTIQVVKELVEDWFVHQMKNEEMLNQLAKMKERAKK